MLDLVFRAALALFYLSCLVRKFISLFIVAVKRCNMEYKKNYQNVGSQQIP